ncbi:hypothetical protein BRADI_3g32303v3 [Brachypodium distachyon]|uniref:Uncharacterized protein n=1 Tax=Brachypodium distachyon TaxID=15368 RepID=A0A2K2D0K5_BRADI|nr:hypothetical protein BRADI_3g32303v3 [Brachypodium distachyon]
MARDPFGWIEQSIIRWVHVLHPSPPPRTGKDQRTTVGRDGAASRAGRRRAAHDQFASRAGGAIPIRAVGGDGIGITASACMG